MLDDFGYSQLETYARGLTIDDLDPALLEHVAQRKEYTPEQAFEAANKVRFTINKYVQDISTLLFINNSISSFIDLNCDINSNGSIKRLKIFIIKTPKNEVKTIFKYESKIIEDLKTPLR